MLQLLSVSLLPSLMIVAATGDALSLRIPNSLNQVIFLAFFPLAWLTAMPLETIGFHFLVAGMLLGVGFLFFSANVFGGGDAKLLAAAGIWFGPSQVGPFLSQSVIAGGILACFILLWTRISMSWEIHDGPYASKAARVRPQIPYGYAFAIGAILTFPKTWWMVSFG